MQYGYIEYMNKLTEQLGYAYTHDGHVGLWRYYFNGDLELEWMSEWSFLLDFSKI